MNGFTLQEGTEFLYHATYKCLEEQIIRQGLLRGQNSCWGTENDDYKKYVYLALEPDVAVSYAECATDELEDEYDERITSDIIIIAVPVEKLDLDKLEIDENNLSNYTDGCLHYNMRMISLRKI